MNDVSKYCKLVMLNLKLFSEQGFKAIQFVK